MLDAQVRIRAYQDKEFYQLVVFLKPFPLMNNEVMTAIAAIPVEAANEYCSP
jgi:hypothetical protein